MRVLVIGGTKDIGKEITDYFGDKAFGIGRSNGFNVSLPSVQDDVAEKSLEYDLVIAVANANNKLAELVEKIARKWIDQNHEGYLFCFGSTAIYHDSYKREPDIWKYICGKEELKELARYISYKTAQTGIKMRFTHLQVGRLDNEKARSRPNFSGGIKGRYLAELIEFYYNSPAEYLTHEVVIDPRY